MSTDPPLYILDAIGPFFRGLPPGRINWSKIPFAQLEPGGQVDRSRFPQIRIDVRVICERAAACGFNALSMDDLAHLYLHPSYPSDLKARIQVYQEEFGLLFDIAAEYGLGIYLTTDIMFFNGTIQRECGRSHGKIRAWLAHALDDVFFRFPQLRGIISRIGESDGLDVEGDFRSRLTIRQPRHARRYLNELLPVFEKHDRRWIFRTWSVGAYRVGDLIWNRDTLHEIFDGIQNRHLVLSMKHGESDFFRYLPLSKQFARGHLPRIIELQARREYEGAGEYPSFIGPDVEQYHRQLRDCPALAGVMIWGQTGGWTRFNRLTFLDPAAWWNEVNTWVGLRVFRDGITAQAAVDAWRARYAPQMDQATLYRFLMLSDEVVRDLLYVAEFARKKVYFRRLRIPPLLAVFWDHVLINHSMRQVLRCFVTDGEAVIQQGQESLKIIEEMKLLAERLSLPTTDLDFMYDTFEILAAAREYYFRDYSPAMAARLTALRDHYRARHARRYSIHLDFQPVRIKTKRLRWYLRLLFRDKRGYRLFDRIVTIRLLGWAYPLLQRMGLRFLPEFSRQQAMGIDTVFK